jgi:hypothetical protein
MSAGPRLSILAALALAYLGLMFLGTHLPLGGDVPIAVAGSGADKLIHALAYAGLAALLLAVVSVARPPSIAAS